jgi:hypothetical protein
MNETKKSVVGIDVSHLTFNAHCEGKEATAMTMTAGKSSAKIHDAELMQWKPLATITTGWHFICIQKALMCLFSILTELGATLSLWA